MARSQRDDLIPPANKAWVWQEDKCADSLAAQFFERNFNFVLAANISYVGAEPEHSCRVLHVSHVTLRIGVRGVDKDTNRTDRWRDLAQEFQPLGHKRIEQEGHAGHIAPRSIEGSRQDPFLPDQRQLRKRSESSSWPASRRAPQVSRHRRT